MKRTTLALSLLLGASSALPALAQQSLPQPLPPFKGVIGKDFRGSKPDWPKPEVQSGKWKAPPLRKAD